MPTLVPRSTEIIYSPGRIFSNLNLPPKNLPNNLVVVRVVCNVFSSVSNNITSASGTITPLPYAAFPSIVNFSSMIFTTGGAFIINESVISADVESGSFICSRFS